MILTRAALILDLPLAYRLTSSFADVVLFVTVEGRGTLSS
jgi:hypothetical protein